MSEVPGLRSKRDLAVLRQLVERGTELAIRHDLRPVDAVYAEANCLPVPVPLDVRVDATECVEEAVEDSRAEVPDA